MIPDGGEGYPKRVRLRRRREYLAVQRGGRRITTEHFVAYGRGNGGRPTRLGITVSRKVGKAVVRNRVKRLLREAFRRHLPTLPVGVDFVMVARAGRPAMVYETVATELLDAVERLKTAPTASRRGKRRRRGGGAA